MGVAGGCDALQAGPQAQGTSSHAAEQLLSSFCERDLALQRLGIFSVGSLLLI